MMMRPQRSVLRRIATRRDRTERSGAHPAWVTFLTGSSPETVKHGRSAAFARPGILMPREMDILHLVARGETDQVIANRLYLSRRTVNCHVSNILSKLDVPSRRVAVITAARIGLL
jgi:DNA-binding NarL/FixJ family response regulator